MSQLAFFSPLLSHLEKRSCLIYLEGFSFPQELLQIYPVGESNPCRLREREVS